MNGQTRRKRIIDILQESRVPVSGTELADKCGVSRQIIVQDIALIRAENKDILSTNKGYILLQSYMGNNEIIEVICVKHDSDKVFEELCIVVDFGGKMLDVFVEHEIYGQIRADLIINNRQDAEEFVQKLNNSSAKPLKELTGGCHYHTIAAPDKKTIERIKDELKEKNILL